MLNVVRRAAAVLSLVLLSACALPKPDPTVQSEADKLYAQAQAGDVSGIESKLAPELRTPESRKAIQEIAAQIPKSKPKRTQPVNWSTFRSDAGPITYGFVEDVDHGDTVVVLQVQFRRASPTAPMQVTGFHIQGVDARTAKANSLTLQGKSGAHYAVAGAAVLNLVLIPTALLGVFVRRGVRMRWLWFLFILLGFGKLTMNWATGQMFFDLLSVQLFAVGAFKQLSVLAPWTVSVSVPLGAILFHLRRHAHRQQWLETQRRKERQTEAAQAQPSTDTPSA